MVKENKENKLKTRKQSSNIMLDMNQIFFFYVGYKMVENTFNIAYRRKIIDSDKFKCVNEKLNPFFHYFFLLFYRIKKIFYMH